MHRQNSQQENSVHAKFRHDLRSRFSLLIGVLEIMSEDETSEAQRESILKEKKSVERCLEDVLAAIQSHSSASLEPIELKAFEIVRAHALPCLERLTVLAHSHSQMSNGKSAWAETLLQEVFAIKVWCGANAELQNGAPQRECTLESTSPDGHASATKKQIMVIDDEPHNLDLVRMFLKKADWKVITFTSGEDAIKALQSTQCDLILLDLNLSGQSGLETLESLKNQPATQNIQVIMMTGSEDSSALEACLEAGAASILPKPFSKSQLLEQLKCKLT